MFGPEKLENSEKTAEVVKHIQQSQPNINKTVEHLKVIPYPKPKVGGRKVISFNVLNLTDISNHSQPEPVLQVSLLKNNPYGVPGSFPPPPLTRESVANQQRISNLTIKFKPFLSPSFCHYSKANSTQGRDCSGQRGRFGADVRPEERQGNIQRGGSGQLGDVEGGSPQRGNWQTLFFEVAGGEGSCRRGVWRQGEG